MGKIHINWDSNNKIPSHPRDKAHGFLQWNQTYKKYKFGSFIFPIQSHREVVSFKDNKPWKAPVFLVTLAPLVADCHCFEGLPAWWLQAAWPEPQRCILTVPEAISQRVRCQQGGVFWGLSPGLVDGQLPPESSHELPSVPVSVCTLPLLTCKDTSQTGFVPSPIT